MLIPVLGLKFFLLGSWMHGQKDFGSQIRIRNKEFKYFLPKKLFLRNMIRASDPGVKKKKATGSRIRNSAWYENYENLPILQDQRRSWADIGSVQKSRNCNRTSRVGGQPAGGRGPPTHPTARCQSYRHNTEQRPLVSVHVIGPPASESISKQKYLKTLISALFKNIDFRSI